jgi:hypothetical protein
VSDDHLNQRPGIDPRLDVLLAPLFGPARHDQDGTIELTVIVDGTIISGSVVSEEAWSRRQNEQISTLSEHVAAVLEPAPGDHVRYIHFLEPTVLSGGNPIRLNATRVDLRSVSAWSVGRLQYGER